ncbi:hypothetical protein BKA66DRAFT_461436 [Pyrenochaeta sp. MPI-SDFR-AT-0127]|nr:hypothetical protein BKA66DRAFT_461436 [Pyrenochaeta sp. MPI-SDFR-AT-0127]
MLEARSRTKNLFLTILQRNPPSNRLNRAMNSLLLIGRPSALTAGCGWKGTCGPSKFDGADYRRTSAGTITSEAVTWTLHSTDPPLGCGCSGLCDLAGPVPWPCFRVFS